MKKIIYIVIAVVVLVGGYVLINKKNSTKDTGPIKIGAVLNMTGTFANQGENSQKGINLKR